MAQSRTPPPFGKARDTQRFRLPDLQDEPAAGRAAAGATGLWVLESRTREIGGVQRTPLRPLPFRIGRAAGLALVLPSAHVSKHHAEIYSDGLALRIRDLGSRNGTFVNRQAVADTALHEQDVAPHRRPRVPRRAVGCPTRTPPTPPRSATTSSPGPCASSS